MAEFAANMASLVANTLPSWVIGVLLDAVATLAGTAGKQYLRHAAVSRNAWYYLLGLLLTAIIDPAFDLWGACTCPSAGCRSCFTDLSTALDSSSAVQRTRLPHNPSLQPVPVSLLCGMFSWHPALSARL